MCVCSASSSNILEYEASQNEEQAFGFTCLTANAEEPVLIETDTISVFRASSSDEKDLVSIAITSWSEDSITIVDGSTSGLLSSVKGITVTTSDGNQLQEAEGLGNGISISMTLSSTTKSSKNEPPMSSLCKTISCKYFDDERSKWEERGIILRGMHIALNSSIVAICLSSHLTLFTIENDHDALKAVEESINSLSQRLTRIGSTDLLDDNTHINWPVLTIFAVCTVLTIIIASLSKCRHQKDALKVARKIFVQEGILRKPSVIGSLEYVVHSIFVQICRLFGPDLCLC